MKTVGIVVEYNPLHNGHLFHIEQARKQTEADVVIAVMSGYFLQRGEPAVVSKWVRTQMALKAGVDIVMELPYIYSSQKAETFAEGAMKVLAALGVDTINFGSESGTIEEFYNLLDFMNQHQDHLDELVKERLNIGVSYPRAMSEAFKMLLAPSSILSLDEPNNILGYHYIKAIQDLKLSITASTIIRKEAHFHEESIPASSTIASATSIRKRLQQGTLTDVMHVVPSFTYKLLQDYRTNNSMFHTWEQYFSLLQYRILSSSYDDLKRIYECEEGLEYRVKETIKQVSTFHEWMALLKTKRYTRTRLQRYATHLLTNTTKEEINELCSAPVPPYLRLLGMSNIGQSYLNKIKKDIPVPLINRFSKAKTLMAQVDERVANVYFSPLKQKVNRMKEEYSTPPIRL